MKPPDIVQRVFDQTGRDWTAPERTRVQRWLWENQQLRHLLFFAALHLDSQATVQDAEDAWADFFVYELDKVISGYNPLKGRFWSYLLLCFKRYCWRWATRRSRERLLPETINEAGKAVELVLVDTDEDSDPMRALLRQEKLRELQACVNDLPSNYRPIIVKFYFEEKSGKKTATEMGVTENNVKTRLCRARQQLKRCLADKGWIP